MMHGSLQSKNAVPRAAIITEQIFHRSIQQGAREAPLLFLWLALRAIFAVGRTAARKIGESRSKLRAFAAGSAQPLPVFLIQLEHPPAVPVHPRRFFLRFQQEPPREHRRHPGN
jgi:hypothetical protein